MSNKIVPSIYRGIIDDVIASIKPEFDEYGVSEEVLADLQKRWENKVIQSHVAEFEAPAPSAQQAPPHPPYPPHPMHAVQHPHYPPHNHYIAHHAMPQNGQPHIKAEPVEPRFMLAPGHGVTPYGMAPLPGPQIPGRPMQPLAYPARPVGQAPPAPTARYPNGVPNAQTVQAPTARIPQSDGPSSSSSDSSSPPPSQSYAPRSLHPSLPQPSQHPESVKPEDSEAINSDLDDSDSDNDEEGEDQGTSETDIVFCTYDKVARVKNKWKCILKDGMIHINGKDYLFAKCTGEFDW